MPDNKLYCAALQVYNFPAFFVASKPLVTTMVVQPEAPHMSNNVLQGLVVLSVGTCNKSQLGGRGVVIF